MKKKIEILAPAKDLIHGMAAINAGADAVYIGAPQFGARSNANNSIEDVADLVKYAHLFNAQVFVVINTILYDNELETCRKMIYQLYDIGVDALIVQDMAIMEMELPPIVLHASTQANNRDADKIKFLKDAGIKRVVLARELNLHQIKEISEASDVELEFFVTGALCVSFSGNCYMSVANGERSANRGSCAQNCRLPYNLIDGHGDTLIKNSHLLSIKDFDVSDQIPNLIEAGIVSFKIEGRLKDIVYVKNNVSYLRQKLDAFLEENSTKYTKASSGKCTYTFDSSLDRSFNRGYTDYFVNERHQAIGSWESPKSKGQYIGKLIQTVGNSYEIENGHLLNNGDGLCFINENNEADGIYVNRAENGFVFPNVLKEIKEGTFIYRNNDAAFIKIVEREDSAVRKISTTLLLSETENGFQLMATDEDGNVSTVTLVHPKETTKNNESIEENFKINLAKTGFTPYTADEIDVVFSQNWFLPISKINEMRRTVYEQLSEIRLANYVRHEHQIVKTSHPYPESKLDFTYNVANKVARKFYERHGVTEIEKAFELQWDPGKSRVMTTKYCIKYELEKCPKYHKDTMETKLKEPLVLKQGELEYKLKFNCKPCEMEIWEKDAEFEIEED
ncbi:peptidase U32 family protein [Flavobacterium aquatile]|uniref:Peptidase U32 n=1 Tax=Flavobacterium aquatile LMG 4008 = ATCC 11947 TaxID=1453498 RepID=A0A095SYV0_9FLAO|nr:U32 family peptidase [Flavobacterium aquatile]KGD69732.1 peptidase U32 [Flavobacterium aquatile LMG 4008 = ATCC 11947]OXA65273.1 peptidase U32 [Flavobacterium aquatile] [Flavobacterium aquatile LMG 4008 = ATCC 11947]GEC77784.1 peptidase U32 [Flavobacterium aquatile]